MDADPLFLDVKFPTWWHGEKKRVRLRMTGRRTSDMGRWKFLLLLGGVSSEEIIKNSKPFSIRDTQSWLFLSDGTCISESVPAWKCNDKETGSRGSTQKLHLVGSAYSMHER